MIDCIREEYITEYQRDRYLEQVALNQAYIRRYATPTVVSMPNTYRSLRWLSASPVNTSTWVALVVSSQAMVHMTYLLT
jgi:hypothetical protein